MEKIHSGVYWAIFDAVLTKRRRRFQAWGILFEEYINWFLALKRKRLADISFVYVTRILPIVVVQDPILRGPFVNWQLNKFFSQSLDRNQLRQGVSVDALTVVTIHELETTAESSEGGTHDIFHGLQLRCFRDPDMVSELHDFLMAVPGYGQGKSKRILELLQDQWNEMEEYLFGGDNARPDIDDHRPHRDFNN